MEDSGCHPALEEGAWPSRNGVHPDLPEGVSASGSGKAGDLEGILKTNELIKELKGFLRKRASREPGLGPSTWGRKPPT